MTTSLAIILIEPLGHLQIIFCAVAKKSPYRRPCSFRDILKPKKIKEVSMEESI